MGNTRRGRRGAGTAKVAASGQEGFVMLIPIVAVFTVVAVTYWSLRKERQEDDLLRGELASDDRSGSPH